MRSRANSSIGSRPARSRKSTAGRSSSTSTATSWLPRPAAARHRSSWPRQAGFSEKGYPPTDWTGGTRAGNQGVRFSVAICGRFTVCPLHGRMASTPQGAQETPQPDEIVVELSRDSDSPCTLKGADERHEFGRCATLAPAPEPNRRRQCGQRQSRWRKLSITLPSTVSSAMPLCASQIRKWRAA